MTTTFETAKVGDRVWCVKAGWGEILDIDSLPSYPILVEFSDDEYKTYTAEGFHVLGDVSQTLFWDEVKFKAPTKPISYLPVDTKVLVWNKDGDVKCKRHFSHFENGFIQTFNNGCTSWTIPTQITSKWDHWEVIE